MQDNFDRCMDEVFKHEGGYVWHPRDPGGETNLGISRRSYPKEDIKGMTHARAAFLYRRDFWDAMRCDELPQGVDLVAFDAAVNSGPGRSVRWLQTGAGVAVDGKIGPVTIAATRADPPGVVDRALAARMTFLRRLDTFPTFGRGWTRRVDSVRREANVMAAIGNRPVPKPLLVTKPPAPPAKRNWLVDLLKAIFGGRA